MASKRLTKLKRGQTAVVAAVNGAHYSSKHLADIGFVRGARIEMLRPGSPCIVKIHEGACVALGVGYQVSISVEPLVVSIAPSSAAEAQA